MAACGTNGGYHAHHYRDEEPCAACRAAHAADRRSRRVEQRVQAAADFEEALAALPDDDGDEFDELADLREAHRMVRAEMFVAKSSRERASLAKVRMELGQRIKTLEAAAGVGKEEDPVDEILQRREQRRAARLSQA